MKNTTRLQKTIIFSLLGALTLLTGVFAYAGPTFIVHTSFTSAQGTTSLQAGSMPPECGQAGVTFQLSPYTSSLKFGQFMNYSTLTYTVTTCSIKIQCGPLLAGKDSLVFEKIRNSNPTDTHYVYRWKTMGGAPPQGFRTGFYFQKGQQIGAVLSSTFATQTWVGTQQRGNSFTFEYEGVANKPGDSVTYTSIAGVNYLRWTNGKIWVWEVPSNSNTNFNNVVKSILLAVNSMDTSIHWIRTTCNGYVQRSPVTWNAASYAVTSVDDSLVSENRFEMYPNPATDYLNVLTLKEGVLAIYDSIGNEVMRQRIDETAVQLDVSGLPAGCYVISFNDLSVRKFIKQ